MKNSSTSQQVAKMHVAQVANEVIKVTPETFGWFKAGNTYEINAVNYECIEVVTKGKGNHTLYRMQNNATGEMVEGDIADLKNLFGIEFVNNYKTSKNPFGKVFIALSKVASLVAECNDDEMTKSYNQLKGLAGLKDAEVRKEEQRRKDAEDAENKKNKDTEKMVNKLREQGMPEELIEMYLANRK